MTSEPDALPSDPEDLLSQLSDSERAGLCDLAVRLAHQAAENAAKMRRDGVEVAASKSTQTDVVTAADRATEQWLREQLAAERPDDGFFGEESDPDTGTSGLTWVVDPIDGTVNYLYGFDQWAVSVAVVAGPVDPAKWQTVAGAVVSPGSSEVYAAVAGMVATRNGQQLRQPPAPDLAMALIGTGFAYSARKRTVQAEAVARLIPQVRDIRRFGAASLDLCAVAAGLLDGYYESGLNPWDHAAGALIARESGASVGGLAGARESQNFLYTCNPGLATLLERALVEVGADDAAGVTD